MSSFKKFQEELASKEKFYSLLTSTKIVIKSMNIILSFGVNLKWKQWKILVTGT